MLFQFATKLGVAQLALVVSAASVVVSVGVPFLTDIMVEAFTSAMMRVVMKGTPPDTMTDAADATSASCVTPTLEMA